MLMEFYQTTVFFFVSFRFQSILRVYIYVFEEEKWGDVRGWRGYSFLCIIAF